MRRIFLSAGLLALALSAFAVVDGASRDARASGHAQACNAVKGWAAAAASVADDLARFGATANPQENARRRIADMLDQLLDATGRVINSGGSGAGGGSTSNISLNYEEIRAAAQDAQSLLLPAVQAAREAALTSGQASQVAAGLRRDVSLVINLSLGWDY